MWAVAAATCTARRSIVFPTKDGFRFALTYGPDAEWVQQRVGARGGAPHHPAASEYELTEPEIVTDLHRQHVPVLERLFLRALRVSDFIGFRSAR